MDCPQCTNGKVTKCDKCGSVGCDERSCPNTWDDGNGTGFCKSCGESGYQRSPL